MRSTNATPQLRTLACCLIAVLLLPQAPLQAQERISKPGQYAGFSPKLYDGWQRTSFHVPVHDGTRLAVDLYRPSHNGKPVDSPYPVIWMRTPYQRGIRQPDGSVKRSGTV